MVRERLLARAGHLLARPDMFVSSGQSLDVMAQLLLGDLCFIDGREADFEAAAAALKCFGKLGVVGPFVAIFGEKGQYCCEVASVYAELFHQLGYLSEVTTIDETVWAALTSGLRERFEDVDWRPSQVEAELGPPSYIVGKTVWCYAPSAVGDRWVYFDFTRETVMQYETGKGSYADLGWKEEPLLRDIRVTDSDFDSGLILTLYGKVQRWGTGWWIKNPSTELGGAPKGVAAQLREIEQADPSQALRRSPPSGYRPD